MRIAGWLVGLLFAFCLLLLALSCGGDDGAGPEAQNSAPIASFTVTPTAGSPSTTFHVDASASADAEDVVTSLQVRWDWENDGTWDTQWSITKTSSHQYGAPGTKTIKLELKDTGGLTASTTRIVAVAENTNTAPTAAFTAMPSSAPLTAVFQFDASGSSDAEDPTTALNVRWDWENDGTWDVEWSSTKTASHQFDGVGAKTVKLEVRDTGGLTGDTTRTIVVTETASPPELVLVPAGAFTMGDGLAECGTHEREVTLTHSYYLGQYEVTNEEYRDALQWAYDQGLITATDLGANDFLDGSREQLVDFFDVYCQVSFSVGTFSVDPGKENYPVVGVSWYGAVAYCDWLSVQAGFPRAYDHSTWQCNEGSPYSATGYRLPTDVEWEYAAQYGDGRTYPWGEEPPGCARATYFGCVVGEYPRTSSVGSHPAAPAALGLYDLAGNVEEWCNDWHACDLGTTAEADPVGPSSGSSRVLHGGSWNGGGDYSLRCSTRFSADPSYTVSDCGFRIARSSGQ